MRLGEALREAGELDEAMKTFERAAALIPAGQGNGVPHAQMAEIALERKELGRAIRELQAVIGVDYDNLDAARRLASLMKEAGVKDSAPLREVHERIVALDPYDAESHGVLGRLAIDRNDADTAVHEFTLVLALKPVDRAAAHTDLADSYFRAGRKAEARKQTLAALEIAPTYDRAQELLLKLVEDRQ
jgi:tetratricopeptide (TPR) repeat protein